MTTPKESPASAAGGVLDNGYALLLLGAVLVATLLLVGQAVRRRQPLRPFRSLRLGLAAGGLVALIVLLMALPAGGAGEARANLPRLYYGDSFQGPTPSGSQFALMRSAGVRSVHFGVGWPQLEPSPASYDFSRLDDIFTKTAKHHLDAFPSINGTPSWVDPDPIRLPVKNSAQKTAWKNMIKVLVDRYGPSGSFWRQHPRLPKVPMTALQVWNEANFFYFTDPRSPTQYGQLVKITHQAVQQADPKVQVILCGLFAHPKEKPPKAYQGAAFLNQLYRVPNIKKAFSGVALHPYASNAGDLGPDITQIRRVMARHGDSRTGLWLTEIGWGSGHGTRFEKGVQGQVHQLTRAFTLLRKNQRAWRIQRIYWFAWNDLAGTCNFCDSVGLITQSGKRKPAFFRYKQFALGRR